MPKEEPEGILRFVLCGLEQNQPSTSAADLLAIWLV